MHGRYIGGRSESSEGPDPDGPGEGMAARLRDAALSAT
jgi:hypothetical protein